MPRQVNVMRLAWRAPLDPCNDAPIAVGDVIRTGENLHPRYEIIATNGDMAWVRDIQYGTDHIVPVARCSRVFDDTTLPCWSTGRAPQP